MDEKGQGWAYNKQPSLYSGLFNFLFLCNSLIPGAAKHALLELVLPLLATSKNLLWVLHKKEMYKQKLGNP